MEPLCASSFLSLNEDDDSTYFLVLNVKWMNAPSFLECKTCIFTLNISEVEVRFTIESVAEFVTGLCEIMVHLIISLVLVLYVMKIRIQNRA